MDYKKLILKLLLDKYEESRHYAGDAKINRRITLPFDSKTFPQYDIERTEIKDKIQYSLNDLENRGIIAVEWQRFEVGNIVDKVYLNTQNVEQAYVEAERKPKKNIVADILLTLKELNNEINTDWIRNFIEIQINEMEEKKNLAKYIPHDENIFTLLIKTLKGLDNKGEEDMLERVFSKRYLGGSKLFESKVRSRLCTILRGFYPGSDGLEDEETLQQIGLTKTVEDLLFQGPLKIKLFDHIIDFSPFFFGASMNTGMIRNFDITELNVNRVITIENKANYIEFTKKHNLDNTLAIYLGGFYSPVKRIFLKKVYDFIKIKGDKVTYLHWGDIDLGGFNIFMQLKSKLIDELIPLYMDLETLRRYMDYGEKFDNEYGKKLEKLMENNEFLIFHELIKEMLNLGIKLEQEALL